ncbi:unnamed protein product, partial [Amoebophrya sp. A25]
QGVDDERTGHLFFHLKRVISECRPRFFILENVKGLLSIDEGSLIQDIKRLLEALDYEVSYEVVDAAMLLPQR